MEPPVTELLSPPDKLPVPGKEERSEEGDVKHSSP